MTLEQITQAFHARLQAFPFLAGIEVSWLGIPYEPKEGQTYLSPRMSSYTSQVVGAGADGLEQHDGSYTISVRGSADDGTAVVGMLCGELRTWFKRGTPINGGGPVVILQSTEQQPAPIGSWLQGTVVVTWTALVPQA